MPTFLRKFELARLARDTSTVVALDDEYRIQWVNPSWERFARENSGDAIGRRFGVGASYLGGIGGPLRLYYQAAFDNALLTGEPFELDYECSSADRFRRFHMLALPVGREGLVVAHSGMVEHPHGGDACEALELAYRLPAGIIVQCANCRRVRRTDGASWDWVPAWVTVIPPQTSHGLCASCRAFYLGVSTTR